MMEGHWEGRVRRAHEGLEKAQESVDFWTNTLLDISRWWVRIQTPRSVWDEYRENGYTRTEAVLEELSCND